MVLGKGESRVNCFSPKRREGGKIHRLQEHSVKAQSTDGAAGYKPRPCEARSEAFSQKALAGGRPKFLA
jgi:hypothetical protein